MAIKNPVIDEQELKRAVGKRIRELREARAYSQVLVADLIGMSSKYYSEIELGKRNLSFINMVKIAMAFSVTLDELLYVGRKTEGSEVKVVLTENVESLQSVVTSLKRLSESV